MLYLKPFLWRPPIAGTPMQGEGFDQSSVVAASAPTANARCLAVRVYMCTYMYMYV